MSLIQKIQSETTVKPAFQSLQAWVFTNVNLLRDAIPVLWNPFGNSFQEC